MGIRNLMDVLKRAGVLPGVTPQADLPGSIVAIDGAQFISRHLSTAHRRHVEGAPVGQLLSARWDRRRVFSDFVGRMLEDLRMMVEKNISPVIILDGETTMDQKSATREKRLADRKKTEERESAVRKILAEVPDIEAALRNEQSAEPVSLEVEASKGASLTDLMAISAGSSTRRAPVRRGELPDTLAGKVDYLRSLSSRSFPRLSPSEMEMVETLLAALGFRVFQAPDEGERFCSFLARQGVVDYVLTTDSDVLAFGAPRLLRSADSFGASPGFSGVADYYEIDAVLKSLDMTREQFIDLCILLGTDFNVPIPRVGPVTAMQIHRDTGGSLDGLPSKYAPHREALNIEWCREFFKMEDLDGIEMTREEVAPGCVDEGEIWDKIPEEFHGARDVFTPLMKVLTPNLSETEE